ncbi:MAG: glycosyltransferase [Burkholderiales bacterium]|nr:glycosyltransferase [Phycisphaerae bacterium]
MLSELINISSWVVSTAASVPLAALSAELLCALLPARSSVEKSGAARKRIAVLIPAHNESAMIEATVRSIKTQLTSSDRLLVVADNCTDNTADLALRGGAEVIERSDATNRGKGYALDYGVRHLAANPPEILIIVDSDVRVRTGSLDALADQVIATKRPAQSVYILQPPDGAGMRDQISHLAFTVRNRIRPRGLMRLAGICPLFGAGMAFPWEIIAAAPLASGNIVEDLALGLDLAAQGHGPMLCEAARVDGTLVTIEHEDNLKQRRRWEHGHMRTLLHQAPQTVLKGIANARPRAVMLGLDVMIPPLSLMAAIASAAIAGLLILALAPGVTLAPALMLASWLLITGALVVGTWLRFAECDRPLRPLLAIPGYVIRKLPLYASFFTRAEHSWQRAARPANPETTEAAATDKHAA